VANASLNLQRARFTGDGTPGVLSENRAEVKAHAKVTLKSQPDRIDQSSSTPHNKTGEGFSRLSAEQFQRLRWLLLIIPVISVGLVLWLSWTKSARLPTGDEWTMVPIVERFRHGNGTFDDLWRPNANGHRLLWTRLQTLPVIWLTGWNRQEMLIFSVFLVVVTWLLLMDGIRRTFEATWAVWLLLAPTALLMFSGARYHNWLKPYTDKVPTALGVGIVAWALTTARSQSKGWFPIALVGALIASFSSLGGLVVWFAFVPAVFERSRKLAFGWILAATATIALYLIDYPFTSAGHPLSVSTNSVFYVLSWLGSPVGARESQHAIVASIASIVGLLVALLFLHWPFDRGHNRTPRPVLVWVGLAAFALGVSILIALEQDDNSLAVASRFLAFSVMWWIAFLVIGLAAVVRVIAPAERESVGGGTGKGKLLAAIYFGVMLIIMGGTITTSRYGFQRGIIVDQDQRASEICVLDEPLTDECLANLGESRKLRRWVSILKDERLTLFR
jgi:hypothetical protein